MNQTSLQFPQDFFEEEVRDGFYIPSAIKQAWGAQLEVLYEIDRICKKYNIPYFADWGTLLGAVRHGGFIPWDDDLDITMKRKDYEYFMEIADAELPEGFATINYARHHDFWMFLGRVVNTRKACFEKEHLRKFHGFPYIAGVDIFVLDYVSPDAEKEELRVKKARYVIAAADEIAEGKIRGKEIEETLQSIEKFCQVKLKRTEDMYQLRVQLYRVAEELFAAFPEEECKELTRMMPNGLYGGGFQLPKEYYDDAIYLPFEHISIPVPIAYDEMLRRRYGDYMKLVRDAGGHDYPFFKIQKEHLQEVLDFKIPGYYFSQEELEAIPLAEQPSLKELVTECRTELEHLQKQLEEYIKIPSEIGQLNDVQVDEVSVLNSEIQPFTEAEVEKYDWELKQSELQDSYEVQEKQKSVELYRNCQQILQILADSQQLAIDLGNLIGECKGEEHITIKSLEEYCELLYMVYQQVADIAELQNIATGIQENAEMEDISTGIQDDVTMRNTARGIQDNAVVNHIFKGIQQLSEAVKQISQNIDENILQRKEVVFLPYKADYWEAMASVYQAAMEDAECDVYVIPIPYFYKDYDGALMEMQYEAGLFPKEVKIIKYDEFDFALHRPDIIFIQNPCDSYDEVLSVHPFFYSTNLKQYTDKLIYIPWFILEEFTKENHREYSNMQYYCTRPGVLHSDTTIVQSEEMRELYIEKLTEFAGKETRAIWETKILGLGSPLADSQILSTSSILVDNQISDTSSMLADRQNLNTGSIQIDNQIARRKRVAVIPESWLKLIRNNKSGKNKKIILYYIGVSSFIQYGEQAITKMYQVFETFQEYQEEVIMLWHPHTLIKPTLEKKNPKLYEKYCELERQYIVEGWGIYDDSADEKLAVTVCDAYYGDASTIGHRCREQGKPVMVQECTVS